MSKIGLPKGYKINSADDQSEIKCSHDNRKKMRLFEFEVECHKML